MRVVRGDLPRRWMPTTPLSRVLDPRVRCVDHPGIAGLFAATRGRTAPARGAAEHALIQPTRWASLRGRARRDAAHGVGQPAAHVTPVRPAAASPKPKTSVSARPDR